MNLVFLSISEWSLINSFFIKVEAPQMDAIIRPRKLTISEWDLICYFSICFLIWEDKQNQWIFMGECKCQCE